LLDLLDHVDFLVHVVIVDTVDQQALLLDLLDHVDSMDHVVIADTLDQRVL
jgi:hypothetical protein